MSETALTPARWAEPFLLLFARLCFASLFLPDAVRKLANMDGFTHGLEGFGIPAGIAPVVAWAGASADFLGAVGVLLGYRTRLASLLLIAFTVVATALAHRFWEVEGARRIGESLQFFHNCALVGGFTLLMLRGPGPLSFDRTH